jgi:hypothetical protein
MYYTPDIWLIPFSEAVLCVPNSNHRHTIPPGRYSACGRRMDRGPHTRAHHFWDTINLRQRTEARILCASHRASLRAASILFSLTFVTMISTPVAEALVAQRWPGEGKRGVGCIHRNAWNVCPICRRGRHKESWGYDDSHCLEGISIGIAPPKI